MPAKAVIQKTLAARARTVARKHRLRLKELKSAHENLARPDFLWHYLLLSFATMGRAAGRHGLIETPSNYERVTNEALAALSARARRKQVEETCRAAKVRMPAKKAEFIMGCFNEVKRMGGPIAARQILLGLPGREAKIRFLKALPGIGDKYARNIMMDVYHEDFRDCIAVDARIKSISKAHGLSFRTYSEEEDFYLGIAREAGINGWELDRLLFNFQSEFLPPDTAAPVNRSRRGTDNACRGKPEDVLNSPSSPCEQEGNLSDP